MNARMSRLFLLIIAALCGGSALAKTAPGDVVVVEQGTHQLLRERLSVTRVAVGDDAIANVNVINRHELLITGKSKGVTSLLVWYKQLKQTRAYRIVVKDVENPLEQDEQPDSALGQANIQDGRLSGELPDLAAHSRALHQAGDEVQDRSSLPLGTQVMTEIKIAELSRTTLKQYGLNFLFDGAKGGSGVFKPGSTNSSAGGETSGIQNAFGMLPLSNAFNIVFSKASESLVGALSLLENQGLVRVLAQPSLTAMTGQTATFLAGGEFPIPVSQGGTGGISIEYKEFGVRLSLTPTVLDSQRIALKVAPEVSELDFSSGVQVSGTAVPALTVRRTDTMVELADGESFVISGLVSRNMMANVDKVPFIGSVPILGSFFKSSRYSREERELVMVVTPHLVQPLKPGAKTPDLPGSEYDGYKPDAAELIFTETGKFSTGYSQ